MYDLCDEPELAKELIGLFERGYNAIIDMCEEMELFELNNDGTVQSTGGFGYTEELPQRDFRGRVRPRDMWASAEKCAADSGSPCQRSKVPR